MFTPDQKEAPTSFVVAKGTEDLRGRAEEILARAETFNNAKARRTLHKIAANYERMADRLEKRARETCASDDAS
jgi:hypothetical protein